MRSRKMSGIPCESTKDGYDVIGRINTLEKWTRSGIPLSVSASLALPYSGKQEKSCAAKQLTLTNFYTTKSIKDTKNNNYIELWKLLNTDWKN